MTYVLIASAALGGILLFLLAAATANSPSSARSTRHVEPRSILFARTAATLYSGSPEPPPPDKHDEHPESAANEHFGRALPARGSQLYTTSPRAPERSPLQASSSG